MALSRGAALLVQWRKDRGISQAQACGLLNGFQQSVLSKLERGERTPTRRAAVLLHHVAGIPVEAWDENAPIPPLKFVEPEGDIDEDDDKFVIVTSEELAEESEKRKAGAA
jgi:transcriptional regulator with XRE-family HTH domain